MRLPPRYRLDGDRPPFEGPLGQVFSAKDGDRPVAVEVARPEIADDPRAFARLERAVLAGATFQHAHVVATLDWGRTPDGAPYLVSAWPVSPTLVGVEAGWTELAAWLDQILAALAHIHARGHLHLALAPDRVWVVGVGRERQVRIIDPFRAQIPTELGLRSVHPRYLAPEQVVDDARQLGRWTDLFAVGVLLWEVLTGAPPFQGRATALDAPLPPFTPRTAVPNGVDGLLANLLRPEPLERYDLAADVRAELAAIGGRAPKDALPVPPPAGALRWNRPPVAPLAAEPPAPATPGPVGHLELASRREPPLLGREAEQQALWGAARRVFTERRPGVVVITGPRGSGRTRLAAWLARALEELGAAQPVWVSGRGMTGEAGTSGATDLRDPRGALLSPEPRRSGAPASARDDSVGPWIRKRLEREAGAPSLPLGSSEPGTAASGTRSALPVDPDARRKWLDAEATALTAWVHARPTGGPAGAPPLGPPLGTFEVLRSASAQTWRGLGLIVVDDAHLSEDAHDGLGLAEIVARRADDPGAAPLLVVVTLDRAVFEDRPSLEERVNGLVEQGATRLRLEAPSAANVERELQLMVPLAAATRTRLVAVHGARPGVIREIVRDWAARGWLAESPDGVMLRDVALDAYPDGDEDPVPVQPALALRRRITAAAEATPFPRRFVDLVHLTALAGALPERVFDAFAGDGLNERAMRSGLWEGWGWRTLVSEIHEVARDDADARDDKAYLHRRLGRTFGRMATELHDHGGQAGGWAYAAGFHAALGGDGAFGTPWLLRAAERAAARGRLGELRRASARALELAENDPELASLRPAALLWRARAHEAHGELVDAADRYERARAAFEAVSEVGPAVEALVGLGWTRLGAHDPMAADAKFNEAVTRARQAELLHLEARAIAAKGHVEVVQRRLEDADVLFTRAKARAEELGDRRGEGEALLGSALVARKAGRFDQADADARAAALAFRDAADLVGEVRAVLGYAMGRLQRTVDDETLAAFTWCATRAGMLGQASLEMDARLGLADCARLRADTDVAARQYERCSSWADRADAIDAGVAASLGLARVALDTGDLPLAYDHTRRAADWLGRGPGHPLWATYRLVVATLLARRRDHTQTWQWLWSAQEFGAADTVDRDTAMCLATICAEAAEAGWGNVLRLAGKLGVSQYARLGDDASAATLEQRVSAAL